MGFKLEKIEGAILCPDLDLVKIGKVRQIYDLKDKLLMVATDNISAFDRVLPQMIPGKGEILTKISKFWFDYLGVEHHMISTNADDFPEECQEYKDVLKDRSMLVKKTKPIAIESIIRGYLYGSGYKDYLNSGEICGIPLQQGLQKGTEFLNPIFTPSLKSDDGDINVSESDLLDEYDIDIIKSIRNKSLDIYVKAREYARQRNIIIADTKFEFGIYNDEIILIDEVLTPDSSRFWNGETYQSNFIAGNNQESYDKQIIRDYLKESNAVELSKDIIDKTINKYQEIYNKLVS
jgi:phosphoribosylaminoimidazole-succinocarboxamide synthase